MQECACVCVLGSAGSGRRKPFHVENSFCANIVLCALPCLLYSLSFLRKKYIFVHALFETKVRTKSQQTYRNLSHRGWLQTVERQLRCLALLLRLNCSEISSKIQISKNCQCRRIQTCYRAQMSLCSVHHHASLLNSSIKQVNGRYNCTFTVDHLAEVGPVLFGLRYDSRF
jgi:hypothetical protein